MKDRKAILFTAIGVLTLIVTLFGATYAYLRISIIEKETASMKLKSAEPSGVVTFVTKTEELYISIAANDMSKEKIGTKYFATDDINKNYATKEEKHVFTLAEAKVNSGNNKYRCDYNFKISISEISTMNPEDYGEIVLKFSGDSIITENDTIDLKELNTKKVVYLKGYFNELYFNENIDVSKIINVKLYIKNTNKEQSPYIGDKDLHILIEPTDNVFICHEIIE